MGVIGRTLMCRGKMAEKPYQELRREELLKLLEQRDAEEGGGIRITYKGQRPPWQIVRMVKPRRQKIDTKLCFGSEEEQSCNLIVEVENLQAMVALYKYRGQAVPRRVFWCSELHSTGDRRRVIGIGCHAGAEVGPLCFTGVFGRCDAYRDVKLGRRDRFWEESGVRLVVALSDCGHNNLPSYPPANLKRLRAFSR
jgi:hypothetical protein